MAGYDDGDRFDFRGYAEQIELLQEDFAERFDDFRKKKPQYNLFSQPFTVDVDSLAAGYPPEVIDLQSSSNLRTVHKESTDLKAFYKCLPKSQYPEIVENALKLVSVFRK